MKITREEMKSYINKLSNDIAVNKQLSLELISILSNRIQISKVQDMLYTKNCFINLKDDELYWLMSGIGKLSDKHNLDIILPKLKDDFSNKEIIEFETQYIEINTIEQTTLEIDGVIEVERGEVYFAPKISGRKIKEMFDKNFVIYNFDAQREAVVKDIGIAKVFTPTLNKKNVEDIKTAMRNKKFIPNTITLNVLNNDKALYDFICDGETDGLSIGKFIFEKAEGSILNISDGYHRVNAMFELMDEDENFDIYMHLKITAFDIKKVQRYIRQESLGTKIAESTQKKYVNDIYNETIQFINTLDDAETNILYGRLDKDINEGDYNNICTYEVFRESLEDNYVIAKMIDGRRIATYIKDFYNELNFILDFENTEKNKDTYILSNNMFILYNYLSYKLYNTENWRNKLNTFICDLDFSNDNDLWNNLKIKSRATKPIRKKIYSFVDSKLDS